MKLLSALVLGKMLLVVLNQLLNLVLQLLLSEPTIQTLEVVATRA
jgi:hypothetical protein